MLFVGLTGGIGSGKSSVAARLAELGAIVIDSDRLARGVVEPGTEGHAEVVARFGEGVLAADGSIDRAALAARVFGDGEARKALEAIIHPRVRARTAELAMATPAGSVVVNDVPLLVEAGLAGPRPNREGGRRDGPAGSAGAYQLVVVVLADERIRVARLVADRGMTEADARARIAAQATDDQRRAVADLVIVNNGTLDELRAAVDKAWYERLLPAARPA